MGYSPFTVFNFDQGLVKDRQDWLIPEGAFAELLDGYVLDGVLQSREGYSQYATGVQAEEAYCESRMVSRITAQTTSVTSSTTDTADITLQAPLRRGTIQLITATETLTDDGVGGWTSDLGGSPTGNINYTTGLLSDTVFTTSNAEAITMTYDYHPGLPVMMVANFITSTNVKQLLVADTRYFNRYAGGTDRLTDLTPTLTTSGITKAAPAVVTTTASHLMYTGQKVYIYNTDFSSIEQQEFTITSTGATTFSLDGSDTSLEAGAVGTATVKRLFSGGATDFFHWDNYPSYENTNRLLFTNNVDPIQSYDGTSVLPYEFYRDSAAALTFDFKDNGGANNVTNLRCLRLHFFKDRLVLCRVTWYDGNLTTNVAIPRGIRISGTGAASDDFNTTAVGAGEINLPDRFWINSSSLNRDDLLIYSEQNLWRLQYSGNDIVPFIPDRLDHTRGADAPMGTYTYLNRTISASRRGIVVTDGYNIQEADTLIPDFVFDEIDNQQFKRTFAGVEDKDKQNYLIYASSEAQSDSNESDKILVINFDQGNLATYKLPLSSMGQFEEFFEITWADLSQFGTWAAWSAKYSTWAGNAYSKDVIRTIGGGHSGEVFRLNADETQDNFIRIRGATNANPCVLTTDFQSYKVGDRICINDVSAGMTGLNGVSTVISARTDNTLTLGPLDTTDTAVWGTYTSGGIVGKVVPMEVTTKKFNPTFKNATGIRLGWIYVYYSVVENSSFESFINISGVTQADPVVVTTAINHGYVAGDEVYIRGVGGTTEVNDLYFNVANPTDDTFELEGIDGTAHTAYTSGGVVKKRADAMLSVDVLVNDTSSLVSDDDFNGTTLQLKMNNRSGVTQEKMWKKAYVNQRGNFVQLRLRSDGCVPYVRIHALILGMAPAGRLRDA